MAPREIRPGIYSVGAVDFDRRLFDSLIPLPDGTSYNAYLVQGSEKTALIDAVDPTMRDVLLSNLDRLGVERIDYVVANHAEQDHSGALVQVADVYPEAQFVASPKCKDMLVDHLALPAERIETAEDNGTLSLGDRTLEFIHAPWVHWPETILTYLREDRVLFTCDLFGSHLATTDLYATDEARVYEAAKRYYAEIMMPFHRIIERHLERLEGYDIELIAPSHGPMYDRPEFILEAYRDWVFGDPKNLVVLPYISMHGSTLAMVDYLVDALAVRGVRVERFDLSATDLGKLATTLVDAATLVIGTPTFLVGPHPHVAQAAMLANALRPKLKFAAVIGSYGWAGKAVEQVGEMVSSLRLEMLDPVLCKGFPREGDFEALEALADKIASKHRESGLQ
ncbi:MAG: FprA family A-type flavoprotein [Gemmatimonadetes bacterium]|nr:FprA family A-type flavoprotein [Gemmatimonadota bacterium]